MSQIGKIDYLLHLSALTDASGTLDKRDYLFNNNLESTKLVVKMCKEMGISLVFPSTTSVYGSQSELVDETCTELLPQSPYAECKIQEEKVVLEAVSHGLKAVVLRFGTIHGVSEGMRFHTAVNKFCFQVGTGQSITVWRTALDQKRPYLALSDASRAVSHVISNSLLTGEIYNVVTSNLTVREIITTIKESTIKKCEIDFVDSKIMNQLSYEVSNEKFHLTGFTFKGDLKKDISDTMKLFLGIQNV
jgi:nucleoside-diphosphate-sugar epimerase